jgi:hypothetical protein
MRIFDYIYYRVYHLYKYKWKDSTPGAYATSLVTLLETLNVVILPIFIYQLISNDKIEHSKIYYLIAFFVIFIFNLYRYNKIMDYKLLADKWVNEDKDKHRKRGVLTIVFIVISLVIFLGLAIILGGINRGIMEPIF